MSKITCATCANEENRYCNAKKISVAVNKRRHCHKYVLEMSKVKEKQIIKTIKMGYKEREALRKEYKEIVRQAKLEAAGQKTTNPKYPLTGDLSRFVSTAGEGDG
jgi:hypothetical protein